MSPEPSRPRSDDTRAMRACVLIAGGVGTLLWFVSVMPVMRKAHEFAFPAALRALLVTAIYLLLVLPALILRFVGGSRRINVAAVLLLSALFLAALLTAR